MSDSASVLTIVGARPQFIKAGPVSAAFRQAGIGEILLHTGQHYDESMSDIFFRELGLSKPDINLEVGSGSHAEQTAAMLTGIEAAILERKPGAVLVYGDTNSTLAGALAAAKVHVPVGHVEAGLRSFNRRMPEEVNRIVADHTSSLLFAPTTTAVENLATEGVPDEKVILIGDVMYDAALRQAEKARAESTILADHNLGEKEFILATCHRAESTDVEGRLKAIFTGMGSASLPVVLPLHPRTKGALEREGLMEWAKERVRLIDPIGYQDMVRMEQAAALVVTDSGGVQKEAYFHGVPCVTIREQTEWVELVEMGWNRLASPDSAEEISQSIAAALGTTGDQDKKPYGSGNASGLVAEAMLKLIRASA